MKEIELYSPIKSYLENEGYTVRGEVKDIDVFGIKDERTIAIELKTQISLKLIYQGVERQKIADEVYLAIPISAKKSHQDNYRHFIHLIRRLELGLLVVHGNQVTNEVSAKPFERSKSISKSQKKKRQALKEISLRENDLNEGGTKGKKLTFYKEKVLKVASYLIDHPLSSPKEIKSFTNLMDIPSILQKNYYGWFERVGRGLYQVKDQYRDEVVELLLQIIIHQNSL